MLTLTLSLAALASAPTGAPALVTADTVYLKPDFVHTPEGASVDLVVVIRDGKITALSTVDAVPDGAKVHELEGHLTAGMIALSDQSGMAANEAKDVARMVMDGAHLAHAFTKDHSDYDRLAAEGITSVLLTPPSGSLCGGRTALVKPGGSIVSRHAHLHLSFSSSLFSPARKPTSYAGAIQMLESLMTEPKGGFAMLKEGQVGALLRAQSRAEATRAAAFAKRHGVSGLIYGCARAGDLAATLKGSSLGVALPAWSPGSTERTQASAIALQKAGVPFGFALDAPGRHPASLRMAAAACVRAGMDSKAAWNALTTAPGSLSGGLGRVGAIAAGFDADLVLWTGHPMELTSAVERVWIDGETVHEADLPEAEDEGDDK
jgi:imidazolonepropionase-like amidohydrolase